MKQHKIYSFVLLFITFAAKGQFTYKSNAINTARIAVIDLSISEPEYDPKLKLIQSNPQPITNLDKLKLQLDEIRKVKLNPTNTKSSLGKAGAPLPIQLKGWPANYTQGTPNDNDIAISNNGIIATSVNTNIRFYNDTGMYLSGKSLSSIARHFISKKDTSALNRTFDPRVIYDPEQDRFILVFMQGSSSVDTRIVVGFTQTNDPTKLWNFYIIPGNITGDSSWSDYPIISITKDELFITVNRLKDDTYWKNGFIESYVWQVDKIKGYNGDSLFKKVYYDIKYNGNAIWSMCPAKGGSKSYGPGLSLFSVKPDKLINDSIFVNDITNTIASGKAEMKLKILRTNKSYGLQPNAIQPNGRKLQTNDSRVLSAMYENGIFYLVGNCIDTSTYSTGFYLITIEDYWKINPKTNLQLFSSDTMDFGYPSIAYCGGGVGDNSAIITFSHVSPKSFPGTSLAYVARDLTMSNPAIMKAGESVISLGIVVGDTINRWGDYTGIQRKYNELGVVYFSGSYGFNNNNLTWVGKAKSQDARLAIDNATNKNSDLTIFPIPASEYVFVNFEVPEKIQVYFELIDMQGKKIPLLRDTAKSGLNSFSFNTADIANGIYLLNIFKNENIISSKKIVVSH